MSLYQLLSDRRTEVVDRFVAQVKTQQIAPEGTASAHLMDHIPRFLDEIISELSQLEAVRNSQDAFDASPTARSHGTQRWALGYDLEALVREYGILRHCVMTTIKEARLDISVDEFDVLAKCLNVGVAEAATAYAKYCDSELRAQKADVEFLAEAGQLLTASLDLRVTLTRLVHLLVPRLGDWCVVHIEGDDEDAAPAVAHVDTALVDKLAALYRHFRAAGEPWDGYARMRSARTSVIVTAGPAAVAGATSTPHEEAFHALHPRTWVVVPLLLQEQVLGALICGASGPEHNYTPGAVFLAEELARRAAVAIQNARLYELSQRERSRVEEATRAKDEFVAMLSHELRTPLNAMLGWSRLLRSGSLPDDKREHALEVIERNAAAQSQLVADLLDVSRIISGKIRLNVSQVDPAAVLEMVIEGVRPAADAKRVVITSAVAPGVGTMRGDPDRLEQVFWNLLTNAVKFSPKEGKVEVRIERVDSQIHVTVEDGGIGIPTDLVDVIFDRFRQVDEGSTRGHGGLGLGLAIVKHIVELHGGTVVAKSDGVGHGATFIVNLPISPVVMTPFPVVRERATRDASSGVRTEAPRLDGVRALVVDDEPDARDLLEVVLGSYGIQVATAGSANAALEHLKDAPVDVIVSDIGMPEEDGYALVRKIRTMGDHAKKNVPAVALTAFARNEDRTKALLAGFNAHVAKPVDPGALVGMIADLLGRRTKPA